MSSDTAMLAKHVQDSVRGFLEKGRAEQPDGGFHAVPVLWLYELFGGEVNYVGFMSGGMQGMRTQRKGYVSSGFFNKVIADMKRTGIVGITKDNNVFLTDAAFNIYRQRKAAGSGQ